jgi:hypothetical protein
LRAFEPAGEILSATREGPQITKPFTEPLTAAGFEPATSRLTVEVTHVFTTGKEDLIFAKERSKLRLC